MNRTDAAPALLGWATVYLGEIAGFLTIGSLVQALVLGFLGAVGGYLAKKLLDYIFKKIKSIKKR